MDRDNTKGTPPYVNFEIDSEFLDIMQSVEDASILAQLDALSDAAAPHNFTAQQPSSPSQISLPPPLVRSSQKKAHVHPSFIMGGSLFPRNGFKQGLQSSRHSYSPHRLPRHINRRGRNGLGILLFGSLFCPFTKQFFSLHSPHWAHLQMAGFGIDESMQEGRRCSLARPRQLYFLACHLQDKAPTFDYTQRRGPHQDEGLSRHQSLTTSAQTKRHSAGRGMDASNCEEGTARHVETRQSFTRKTWASAGTSHWSSLLSSTLGTLLKTTPVNDYTAFTNTIRRILKEESATMQTRRIGFRLPPPVRWLEDDDNDIAGAEGGQDKVELSLLALQLSLSSNVPLLCTRCQSHTTSTTPAHEARSDTVDYVADFGSVFVSRTREWRRSVLQLHPKWLQGGKATHSLCSSFSPLLLLEEKDALRYREEEQPHQQEQDQSQAGRSDKEWALRFYEDASLAVGGLPAHTRAVSLRVPFPESMSAPSMVHEVCRAVIADLLSTSLRLSESPLGMRKSPSRIYYCPIEHSVDYNSVLDLVAFPVSSVSRKPAEAVFGRQSCHFAPYCGTREEDAVPLLLIGLLLNDVSSAVKSNKSGHRASVTAHTRGDTAAEMEHNVVVISNAHLLSKRAVGRLIDQWTRNGAASRSYKAMELAKHSRSHDRCDANARKTSSLSYSAQRWQVLLGVEPFSKAVRTNCVHPLGKVQLILVGYGVTDEGAVCGDSGGFGALSFPTVPLAGTDTLAVSKEAIEDVFFIEESLATALLRVGPLYQASFTPLEQAQLLAALTASAWKQLPPSFAVNSFVMRLLPSGKRAYMGVSAPLSTPQGQKQFSEGCEKLLRLQLDFPASVRRAGMAPVTSSADTIEKELMRYSFLSAVTVRHSLMKAYSVVVRASPTVANSNSSKEKLDSVLTEKEASSTQSFTASPCYPGVAVLPVPTRAVAYERESKVIAGLLYKKLYGGCISSHIKTKNTAPTDSLRRTRHHVDVLHQSYDAFIEPSVLLGSWTSTLLFCAPIMADVLLLREYLKQQLRMRMRNVRGEQLPLCLIKEVKESTCGKINIDDVDTFHIDFIAFPLARRCRLFGLRALFSCGVADATSSDAAFNEKANGSTAVIEETSWKESMWHRHDDFQWRQQRQTVGMSTEDIVFMHLHEVLKKYASSPLFFPLWTYNVPGFSARQRAASLARLRREQCRSSEEERSSPGHEMRSSSAASNALTFSQSSSPSPQIQSHVKEEVVAAGTGLQLAVQASIPYQFSNVQETSMPCTPSIVERRLFSLAVAQCPSLRLSVGSYVVLHEDILITASRQSGKLEKMPDSGDSEHASTHDLLRGRRAIVGLPRGTVCVVTGFVRASTLCKQSASIPSLLSPCGMTDSGNTAALAAAAAALPQVPVECQWHIERLLPGALEGLTLYMQQQRCQQHVDAAVPMVRVVSEGDGERCSNSSNNNTESEEEKVEVREFLLLPQPSLVGGYASLHYYSLPVLHLPVHSLEPPPPPAVVAVRGRRADESAHSTALCCYPFTWLYHPYYGGPYSYAVVCLRPEQRYDVLTAMLAAFRRDAVTGVQDTSSPFAFVEDTLFSERNSAVEGAESKRNSAKASARTQMHCSSSGDTLGGASEGDSSPRISLDVLTELSLFPQTPLDVNT